MVLYTHNTKKLYMYYNNDSTKTSMIFNMCCKMIL